MVGLGADHASLNISQFSLTLSLSKGGHNLTLARGPYRRACGKGGEGA